MNELQINIGDVFELKVYARKVYLQYAETSVDGTDLIKIYSRLYHDKPIELCDVCIEGDFFLVHFPLKFAYKKRIVDFVGNCELKNFTYPMFMRSFYVSADGTLKGWNIINTQNLWREFVEELSEEQIKLSPSGVWNDTLLIDRLAQKWTLEKWV